MSGLSAGVLLLAAGVLILASVLASKLTERFGIPALLLFLVLGMVAGSEGLGGIYFDDPSVARLVGTVALILILYAGGLDTDWRHIRPVLARGSVLATIGVLVSATSLGLFATWILSLTLEQGLLLGAVVASTDAAAVFSVLRARGVHLHHETRSLLEYESGSNDPTAVFLTLAFIELAGGAQIGPLEIIGLYVLQMTVGGVIGYVLARAAVAMINRIQLDHDGLYPVLSLALLILTFAAADLARGSGFLAVYVAGVVMGNSVYIHKRSLIRFHDGLAWLGQIVMFLTLGLLVFPSQLGELIVPGLAVAAFLLLVARPLSVVICLAFSRFPWREQAFISWVGLRGAAPIILATFPLVADVGGAEKIFNVVFFVVLVSVLLQGMTVARAARMFGVVGAGFQPRALDSDELPASTLVEYVVTPESELVGRQIAMVGLPDTARLLAVRRYGTHLMPTGGMRLRRDDVLTMAVDQAAADRLTQFGGLRWCASQLGEGTAADAGPQEEPGGGPAS